MKINTKLMAKSALLLAPLTLVACMSSDKAQSVATSEPKIETRPFVSQPTPAPTFEQSSGKVVGAYFPDWRIHEEKTYTPSQIPAGDLTHVIYAFLTMCGPHSEEVDEVLLEQVNETCKDKPLGTAVIADKKAAYGFTREDGQIYEGHFAQFKELKKAYPHLTVLPSFGGWTMSSPFHEMIKTDEARLRFVETAVALIDSTEVFDGIDLDWEYPGGDGFTTSKWNPETALTEDEMAHERKYFTVMLKELREGLDAIGEKNGRYYQLSSAAGVAPSKVAGIDYPEASKYIDNWFAMTYDLFGAWSLEAIGHQSNLKGSGDVKWWSGIDGYVKGMLDAGLPKEKLVLGSAFYSRGWLGLSNYPEGKPYAKNADDTFAVAQEGIPDDWSYHQIVDLLNDEASGWVEMYDAQHEAAFAWNEAKKGFITYDNAQSIKAKGSWVLDQGFAGIYAWEVTHDSDNVLVSAMNEGVANKKAEAN